MDCLSDILDLLQLRGTLYFRTAFSKPWAVTVPPLGRAARFHLVVQGTCHIGVADEPDVALGPGDLVLIPNGAAHELRDEPGRPPARLDDVLRRAGYRGEGVLVYGGPPQPDADTQMICGHLSFAEGADHPLLRALPPRLVVSAGLRARSPLLDELMRLIARQIFNDAPGSTAAVVRLTEALFIEVIRACADQDTGLRGMLDAFGDPRIGRALVAMHRALEHAWTLQRLAVEAGMSRSRFAGLFQDRIGCAPMSYLAEMRLQKAMNLIRATPEPVQRIAARVGYRSPAAFSRAFAGRYGLTPSDARRAAV